MKNCQQIYKKKKKKLINSGTNSNNGITSCIGGVGSVDNKCPYKGDYTRGTGKFFYYNDGIKGNKEGREPII